MKLAEVISRQVEEPLGHLTLAISEGIESDLEQAGAGSGLNVETMLKYVCFSILSTFKHQNLPVGDGDVH